MTDFYSVLGVDKNADQETIKRAYRKLAAQHHPDRGGDKNKFQEIQAAYDTLSDTEKKSQYDNPQPQGFHFQFGGGFPPGFENIFDQHFGGNHPFGAFFGRQQNRNRTINLQTRVTLEEAYTGKEIFAEVKLPSGKNQVLEIKVPPGVDNGTTIRLAGMGDDSIPNAPKGDIHLTITVQPHSRFNRHGDDLVTVIEINCIEAMLGVKKEIQTINGSTLEINIKPGTQPGQVLSVGGYGMPNIQDNRVKGNLLIETRVIVPNNLTEVQKKILETLL